MRNITNPKLAVLALIALAVVAALVGHPIVSTESMVGLGLVPLALGEIDVKGLTELLEKQGRAFEEFKTANDARLKAIEQKGYAPADVVEKVEKLNAEMKKIDGDLIELAKKAHRPPAGDDRLTEEQAEYKEALNTYLRKGIDTGLAELQRKAMNSASDPDGGYLVLPEMDRVIDRVAPTVSALFRLANVVTIGSAKWEKMVKTSGMAARRVADGSTGGESTNPKYAKIAIDAHTAEAEPRVYNETLEDATVDLAMDLAEEAGIAFAELGGSEFISGAGVAGARGITAYSNVANASYAWGSVGYIASGKSAAFASVAPADKIVSLQHALKSQYRPGAAWLCNDTTLGVMRQMKDGSGSYYLWQPDPAAAFGGRFLGSPVEVDDNMPDIGAGAYALAYGNFKRGYTIVNRAGTSLIRDNITVKGQTLFNFRRRFGGGITNFEAIKLMKFATS